MEGDKSTYWLAPIIADAEAGFGGPLNAFELMKAMIEAGASGVHFEDQLASEKKCGHLGGKVLVPTKTFIRTLNAARLAADVCGVDTVLLARTDAHAANLITSDVDDYDHPWIDRDSRTDEGFFRLKQGNKHSVEHAIARGVAYGAYADLVWWETSEPDLGEAREFATEFKKHYPDKYLAYNCSPSFNWEKKMSNAQAAKYQEEIAALGYRYQFVTLAGFHSLNLSMFELAKGYSQRGMGAYSEMQQREFAAQEKGFTAVRHQREVGTSYFDAVAVAISQGKSSTTAMAGSTETEQFHGAPKKQAAE
jgi:isocitrate lyase